MSQAGLGRLVGSKARTISHMENGRTIPTDDTIWRVGAALCLSQGEIAECLVLADGHRKNPDELHYDYAINMAKKRLSVFEKRIR